VRGALYWFVSALGTFLDKYIINSMFYIFRINLNYVNNLRCGNIRRPVVPCTVPEITQRGQRVNSLHMRQRRLLALHVCKKKVTNGAEKTFAPVQLPVAMDVKQFTSEYIFPTSSSFPSTQILTRACTFYPLLIAATCFEIQYYVDTSK